MRKDAFKYRVGEHGTNDRDQAMQMSRYWGLHLHVQAGPRNSTAWFWAGARWISVEELRLASYRVAFDNLRRLRC